MRDVPLEVPLRLLPVGRLLEGHDPGAAGVEVLGEAPDRAALAGRVAALEDDDQATASGLDVALELEQLDLQAALDLVVLSPPQALGVRVILAPGLGHFSVALNQLRPVLAPADPVSEPRSQVVEQIPGAHLCTLTGHACALALRPP